ncbi:PREDICTED: protein PHOTOPERIOD-INDEPENDENT EARLY FLOWERING 1 isoform X2 [Tarenaya hassleriana]|uniref:protein PHOTOPERIOD-INDEPENDENT EARLY FLOWERING 1 isoform X2 n=1 Tax=Tarenaya hassleriana TaxID=28532 RepID=UPI00053C8434|nr:PREDICTED: protein PHOTOPERIOD-INDEPENDENT EARLY FLOWERING 1 isoform X2 [Tarenaya hassleriana]
MASKGGKSKPDNDSRAKRPKTLEAPKEPRRPKTHWDHVLEEMAWLSKDFESERKWKLAQAKKVALRASKGTVDQATREEKKLKEEEQRLRKVALNISKDIKKFWMKIEKLVLYKHQLVLGEKKKKALDKHLEFLLGQTERYSTMLAENLVEPYERGQNNAPEKQLAIESKSDEESLEQEPIELNVGSESGTVENDVDYDISSGDDSEDNEDTIEEDEKHISERERQEELEALQNEVDLPLEELLRSYSAARGPSICTLTCQKMAEIETDLASEGQYHGKEEKNNIAAAKETVGSTSVRRSDHSNGELAMSETHSHELEPGPSEDVTTISWKSEKEGHPYDFNDEQEDVDFVVSTKEEKDDEATLSEEEELAKADTKDPIDEIALLQKESEMPIEELLARYKKDIDGKEISEDEFGDASALSVSEGLVESHEMKQQVDSDDDNVDSGACKPNLQPCFENHEDGTNEIKEENGVKIADAAAAARSAQPTGFTFSTTKVRTKLPFLLKHSLREYQHIGLDWLVTMYEKRLNGILADEMGLGKTIMTISLLAHLACDKGIWGPHLIVVPTSVMLNWETEFLKWCPAFKILTYFGSAKERKFKRQGWMKPNSFHVCITTYRLVIQDSKIFKRKKWKYLILDEAHLIKNWKSQRWQTLLNFNSKRRILLTGTPLQNDLMELWSLMHFLMPHVFQSHQEFKDWFCNPIAGMVEGQEKVNKDVIDRLHNVLRPFILRRLKRDVEKQLPVKHEHVILCRLSKRQRNLYEDFIASSGTQATLASGNFFGMINIIMQLRKVCNHPDLFEGRPIVSSFDMVGIDVQLSSAICSMLSEGPFSRVDLEALGLLFTHLDFSMTSWEGEETKAILTPPDLIKQRCDFDNGEAIYLGPINGKRLQGTNIFEEIQKAILEERIKEAKDRAAAIAWWNSLRCQRKPTYSMSLRELLTIKGPLDDLNHCKASRSSYMYSSKLADIVLSPVERFQKMIELVEAFTFAIPAARAPAPVCWCSKSETPVFLDLTYKEKATGLLFPLLSPIRPAIVRRQVYFPDRRLIQFDCGKLQELAILLRKLKYEGHRALIFTQMTKMLDILEAFINLYGYTYMRLDGSTQPEERQTLMQRFNTNPKIFLFILSTRSGGVGINLVGADTVIFYDSDWNPAMDQQAQDRCHRIGQTREVHIYRLISESTIEENILKKANQKRALDDLVIQGGGYNTEFFKKLDPMELFSGHKAHTSKDDKENNRNPGTEVALSNADVEAALKHAEDEADYMALKRVEQEEAVDNQEFSEEPVDRPEDDELANEDDRKSEEPIDQGVVPAASIKDESFILNYADTTEERAVVTFSSQEEDADMLDDVKHIAEAAAATGQAISSFENQLRPIDRYAVRFLENWDPIINEVAVETEAGFEEKEWELDHIERYKDEMEADIDDGEEPLVYEKWDADFATEAYRQQVEALAQHQLMEDLENEAREREAAEEADLHSTQNDFATKPKKTKRSKKAKFKSLKKGSLASESKPAKPVVKLEASTDDNNDDDDGAGYESSSDSDMISSHALMHRKCKKRELVVDTEDEKTSKKKPKKPKKSLPDLSLSDAKYNQSSELYVDFMLSKQSDSMVVDNELKPASRNKIMGKVSITSMPIKRVLLIKPEKLKKGNLWSRDCVPLPDFWLPQEDAILCAMVHEYGPNWSMISDNLYGMAAGGAYRGRCRHPAYCCERYRELVQRHILSVSDKTMNEKNVNAGSGKALLKVTEENIQSLLNVAAEQPDTEMLLQKHFTCLLSAVWRMSSCSENHQNLSCNDLGFNEKLFGSVNHTRDLVREPLQRMKITSLSSKLLESALQDASRTQPDNTVPPGLQEHQSINKEELDLTLEFQQHMDESLVPFPPIINLSIWGDSLKYTDDPPAEDHLKASQSVAENRYRSATNACVEDCFGWASSTFSANDPKSRMASKAQSLGKHKLGASDSVKSSKGKVRKLSAENSETNPFQEPRRPSKPSQLTNDPSLKFDFTPVATEENLIVEVYECDSGILSEKGPHSEEIYGSEGRISHWYDPGFISGLDDFPSSLESD